MAAMVVHGSSNAFVGNVRKISAFKIRAPLNATIPRRCVLIFVLVSTVKMYDVVAYMCVDWYNYSVNMNKKWEKHTHRTHHYLQASCVECGLVHGDGGVVQEWVERNAPSVIFLDFDQTVSTFDYICDVLAVL